MPKRCCPTESSIALLKHPHEVLLRSFSPASKRHPSFNEIQETDQSQPVAMTSGGLSLLTGTDGTLTIILSSEPCAHTSGGQELVLFMTEKSRRLVFVPRGELFNVKRCELPVTVAASSSDGHDAGRDKVHRSRSTVPIMCLK